MMIAGGAIVAISASLIVYYGLQFADSIQQAEKYRVEPAGTFEVQQNIASGQGMYVVALPDFAESQPLPSVRITDPDNQTIVPEKSMSSPILIELFSVSVDGVHTLTLYNPSTDRVLEASVILGDQETVMSRAGFAAVSMTLIFTILFFAGIAILIAGVVITVMDRKKINKMKQFGDTSDLV